MHKTEFRNSVFMQDMHVQPFITLSQLLMTVKNKAFENIVGKGENASNQHCPPPPPSPTVFSSLSRMKLIN